MGSMLDRARWFAAYYHRNQKYGDQPYTAHLEAVERVLIEFSHGLDIALLAAAWLHDTVEDCAPEVTTGLIRAEFNADVADLVGRVTDEPGKNRAARHAATYPKIAGDERATALKLADRIANVRACLVKHTTYDGEGQIVVSALDKPRGLYQMYRKEHAGFRAALYATQPWTHAMWKELDRLMETSE